MSFSDFIKNDNKSIIWGLLQEGGVFNDIPNNMFENVKKLFESSILSMKPEFDIFFDKNDEGDEDYEKPLKLLAKRIEFTDPIRGQERIFESGFEL